MKRYCFALDLKDDEASIEEYERLHANIAPEIHDSITRTGITRMDIYRQQDVYDHGYGRSFLIGG